MAIVSPRKRDQIPLFQRAWESAFDSLPYGMGIKLSTPNGDTPVNGNHPSRPFKRRRVAEDSPEAARAMPGRLLSEIPDDVEKALRIEVLSITRVDSSNPRPANLHYGNGSPEKKDIPVIKARCRIFICEWSADICRALHCDSQICNFKVFRDSDDVCRTARIYLPMPFQIPQAKLLIERQDDKGFNLDDQYLVRVEIESAGDPKWPPMDLLPKKQADSNLDSSNPRRWILSSQIIYTFEKGRASGDVSIRRKKEDIPLGMAMDMDLRWSTCHVAASSARFRDSVPPSDAQANHINGALAPLTNGHVNGRSDSAPSDCRNADTEKNGMMEDEEDHEEATTPSRSLRTREKQNYNLKLLSDKARGKERKEKKRRKLAATLERKSGSVTWAVPLIGEVTLDNYHCIRCYATHSSMQMLQKHMEVHTDIIYNVDSTNAYIRIFPPDDGALRPSNPTFHSFTSLEDQESDVEGDVSPQKLSKRLSQQRNRPSQSHIIKPHDSKRLIPHIKQPLYDRLSKSLLEPGSLVDPPPVEDTWLVQKHRDIIRDYSDVHQDEKEYIFEWDAFVNKDCVTSEPHLQDVYIRFLQEKAPWITTSQNRITEWAKHLSYLKSRDALTDKTIAEAFTIMRRSRSQKRPEQPEVTKAPSPRSAYRKSVAGCPVCGQPVRGPASLICSNLHCSHAMYHIECIRPDAKQPVESRNWRCNKCHDEPKATT
ncbi:putative zinc finger domain-containing protein [Rosellinia necatrix]|uniref:Putative zinc finger domain-containing protein n=1 Tax=Rosellinia necatrix TaxID=77044 RepID=A0A1W2TK41_ROSNE|nr:putative zinc finger domain-containing protein [Rosellinia necatrix]